MQPENIAAPKSRLSVSLITVLPTIILPVVLAKGKKRQVEVGGKTMYRWFGERKR